MSRGEAIASEESDSMCSEGIELPNCSRFHLDHLDFPHYSKSFETHTNQRTRGVTNDPNNFSQTRSITSRRISIHLPTILRRIPSVETKPLLRRQIKGARDDSKGLLDSPAMNLHQARHQQTTPA
ncbi:hypothetical protein Csa_006997 [Cucumis sativus]|uniref:Uncharacterized protein n=1 Tax=Cucumis sativus TaxID=3659 RepID=A0A0A0LW98_CUCSA|nr:hypothetical protein Csa_006997 [Cucumis sativus]